MKNGNTEAMFASACKQNANSAVDLIYALYIAKNNKINTSNALTDYFAQHGNTHMVQFLSNKRNASDFQQLIHVIVMPMLAYLLNNYLAYPAPLYGSHAVPGSLVELVQQLLAPAAGDTVCNLNCGYGLFAVSTALQYKALCTGIDSDPTAIAYGQMYSDLCDVPVQFSQTDVLQTEDNTQFDGVFACMPFGTRPDYDKIPTHALCQPVGLENFSKRTSVDWAFALQALRCTKSTGKTVLLLSGGPMYAQADLPVRKALVEGGRIETVIALPKGLFSHTAIGAYLVICSQGNTAIRMVDATALYTTEVHPDGSRHRTVNTEQILALVNHDEKGKSRTVSLEQVKNNKYELVVSKFLSDEKTLDNDVRLGDCLVEIRRASRLSMRDFEDSITRRNTHCNLIQTADVQDGSIESHLTHIKKIPPSEEKAVPHSGDLLLSRGAVPDFKAAVYRSNGDQRALVTGNQYILTVDRTRLDPYYLLAFISSTLGQERLKKSAKGTATLMLPIESLKEVKIPLPPLQQQKEIAEETKRIIGQIQKAKAKIEACKANLAGLFDRGANTFS